MSKKSKGVVLDTTSSYGIGGCEDVKASHKYQTLMQDYEDLQKEADFMRIKLEASKQRKLMLSAEVRFLRKRHKYLVKMNTDSLNEQNLAHAPNSLMRAKIAKKHLSIGNEASQHRLPLVRGTTFKKKQAPLRDAFPVIDQPCKKKSYGEKGTKVSNLNHDSRKEVPAPKRTQIFNRNTKDRMFDANDAAVRNSTAAFDLNQDTNSEREASLPTRAPIFDLNEISTGDEDFQSNVEANKLEEARKNIIRGMNSEQQNDLKLSICRNAGERSSRAGKRKITWQDPVALRV